MPKSPTNYVSGNSPADKYLARHNELKARKQPWLNHYQRLAESFLTRKSSFTSTISPGEFLYDDIFDNTGEYAALQAASAVQAMLWPDSSRTFRLKPVSSLADQPGVEEFFRKGTERVRRFMDEPRAGFALAAAEHFLDAQVFGTSGIGVFANPDAEDVSMPVIYEAWDIKAMCISENAQGFVDTIYATKSLSVRQILEKYDGGNGGDGQIHDNILELYRQGKMEERVEVLEVIEPRPKRERKGKEGRQGMPIRTIHIDLKNKFIMRESGMEEFPVAVGRTIKTIGEEYGRSPAMTALPDVNTLNALKEALIVATEKQLDPPLGVLDDGRLGGGTVDTSAGGLNVFNASGRISGEKPVFPIFTVGEMQSSEKLIEQLQRGIMQAFSLDRLLDLNNETQMTAYETSVRDRMRGNSLGALFGRQIAEVFTPVIQRTVRILFRRGMFYDSDTDIPEAVADAISRGEDVYEVEYVSPAQRYMQGEKLQGLLTTAEVISKLGVVPGAEDILDNMDWDAAARGLAMYSNAPAEILRPAEDVEAIRAGRAEAQSAQAQLNAVQQMSEAGRNTGQMMASIKQGGEQ